MMLLMQMKSNTSSSPFLALKHFQLTFSLCTTPSWRLRLLRSPPSRPLPTSWAGWQAAFFQTHPHTHAPHHPLTPPSLTSPPPLAVSPNTLPTVTRSSLLPLPARQQNSTTAHHTAPRRLHPLGSSPPVHKLPHHDVRRSPPLHRPWRSPLKTSCQPSKTSDALTSQRAPLTATKKIVRIFPPVLCTTASPHRAAHAVRTHFLRTVQCLISFLNIPTLCQWIRHGPTQGE